MKSLDVLGLGEVPLPTHRAWRKVRASASASEFPHDSQMALLCPGAGRAWWFDVCGTGFVPHCLLLLCFRSSPGSCGGSSFPSALCCTFLVAAVTWAELLFVSEEASATLGRDERLRDPS